MTWTLRIPRPVPSKNAHYVNGGTNAQRAMYRTLRNTWASEIAEAWRNWQARSDTGFPTVGGQYLPVRKVTLTRIYCGRQREYDYDGLVGGFAPILDAMKPPRPGGVTTFKSGPRKGQMKIVKPVPGAALIVDDAPRWVEVTYRQERGAEAGCLIEIEDL
jgi:hypothetical protein